MKKTVFLLWVSLALVLGGAALASETDFERLTPLEADMFEGPILLTSVGQSADVNIVNTLLQKAEVADVKLSVSAQAEEVAGYKTLVLAVGGSSKGLGAAGIDEKQELARVVAVIEAAKANDVKILSLHVGGQARRGVLSDLFIPDAVKASDAMIVVKSGDAYEGLKISDILFENDISAAYVDNTADVIEQLSLVFAD